MTVVTKEIGTDARDYSTITLWEAALTADDPTGAYDAVGECYDDSDFEVDEVITFNDGAPDSILLTVAGGERHTGIEKSITAAGVRVLCSTNLDWELNLGVVITLEWIEIDVAGNSGGIDTGGMSPGVIPEIRYCLLHDRTGDGTPFRFITATSRDLLFHNNIVYNYSRSSGSAMYAVGLDSDRAGGGCFNNTVFGCNNPGAGACYGIYIISDNVNGSVHNNSAMNVTAAVAAHSDFLFVGDTNVTSSNNMSEDDTADDGGGGNHQINKNPATQFVSTGGGTEDFHIVTGSDAKDNGVDLVTTPSGVEIDIDGRDRDAEGDTWDIGAHEFVGGAPPAATVHPLRSRLLHGPLRGKL